MVTFSNVECAEEVGSASENYSPESTTASVTLRTPFAKRHDLVADILINARKWPYSPVQSTAPRAKSAKVLPVDGRAEQSGQGIAYADALVTVSYDRDSSDDQGQIFSEELEPIAEFTLLDHTQFRWGSSAAGVTLLPEEAPGRLEKSFSYTKTFFGVVNPPGAIMLSLMGHVNNASIQSGLLPFAFAPETLLYHPTAMSRTFSMDGTEGFTVKIKLVFKPSGWNKFWRSQSMAYESIYHYAAGVEYKNYPLGDFSSLITMGV